MCGMAPFSESLPEHSVNLERRNFKPVMLFAENRACKIPEFPRSHTAAVVPQHR